ncbi:MAG: hypothetical protein KBA95_08940, partial [Acidobacteria bacterium]|nr:hypothetical protein [Acidobacteriota bacterium]
GWGRVGPMDSFARLPPLSRVVLVVAMWLGRLELIPVLALVQPGLWRGATWRQRPAGPTPRVPPSVTP